MVIDCGSNQVPYVTPTLRMGFDDLIVWSERAGQYAQRVWPMKAHVLLFFGLVLLVEAPIGLAHRMQTDSISVDDPRPLAKAADMFEGRYGWIITYEDPRYEHVTDLEDVTESVRRSSSPKSAHRVLIPRGGSFSYSFATPPPDRDPEKIAALLNGAVLNTMMLDSRGGSALRRMGRSFISPLFPYKAVLGTPSPSHRSLTPLSRSPCRRTATAIKL
jgi:hypothetical protein